MKGRVSPTLEKSNVVEIKARGGRKSTQRKHIYLEVESAWKEILNCHSYYE